MNELYFLGMDIVEETRHISKFSEINAVYGYSVGNKVLQEIGKYLIENMCNRSSTYRLDGSRFAVVLEECSYEKICYLYDAMRKYFRDGLTIDGALVTLELNASTIMLNDFDIDFVVISNEQKIEKFERYGFSALEWGGSIIK